MEELQRQTKALKALPEVVDLTLLADKLDTYTLLSSSSPFEQILGSVKVYQAKNGIVEEKVAGQLRELYKEAKARLGNDFVTAWVKKFGAGKLAPSQLPEVLAFFQGDEFKTLVSGVMDKVSAVQQDTISKAIVEATDIGYQSVQKELTIVANDDYKVVGRVAQAQTWNRIDPVATAQATIATMVSDTKNLTAQATANIIKELTAGAIAGEGIRELRKRIAGQVGVDLNRADMIARWAVIKSFNDTRLKQYQEAKSTFPQLKKMWLTHLDDRTCPHCASLNGTVVYLENGFDPYQTFSKPYKSDGITPSLPFYGDAKIPPRHPRCRCTITAWMDHWRAGTQTTPEELLRRGKVWAEAKGYDVKGFAPSTPTAGQAMVDDAKDYLANVQDLSDVDRSQLRAFITELKAISSAPSDIDKSLKMSATKTRQSLEQLLDLSLKDEIATNLGMEQSASDLYLLLGQVQSMKVESKFDAIKKYLITDILDNIKYAEEGLTLNISAILNKSLPSTMSVHTATNIDYYLNSKLEDLGQLLRFMDSDEWGKLTKATQSDIAMRVIETKSYISDVVDAYTVNLLDEIIPKINVVDNILDVEDLHWSVASKLTDANDVKDKLTDVKLTLSASAKAELDTLTQDLDTYTQYLFIKKGELNSYRMQYQDVNVLSLTELNQACKDNGIPYISSLTKEEKIHILTFGIDNPKSQQIVEEKKAYQKLWAQKKAQAKKEALEKAKQAQVQTITPADAKHTPDTSATLTKQEKDDILGVYQRIGGELKPQHQTVITHNQAHLQASTVGKPLTFTVSPNQRSLGGGHEKWLLLDDEGNEWLFKPVPEFLAHGEVSAHQLGKLLGHDMADIRVITSQGKIGTAQRMFTNVVSDLGGVSPRDLTDAHKKTLLESQVFDWLISNHDSHIGNFLLMGDGSLMPIDKGQTSRFFGKDFLKVGWRPHTNPAPQYYDALWDSFARGDVDLDLETISDFLEKVEAIPDDVWRETYRVYAEGRDKSSWGDTPYSNSKEFLDAFVERKRNIRKTFEDFYREQAKRRGVDFKGFKPAKQVVKEAKADAQAGVNRAVTKRLAKAVEASEWQGQSFFVGGEHIESGNILISQEYDPSGKKVLRFSFKVREGYDDNLHSLLMKLSGGRVAPTVTTPAIPQAPKVDLTDNYWDDILQAIKTVNFHTQQGTFQYNQSKLDKIKQIKGQLQTAYSTALGKADMDIQDKVLEDMFFYYSDVIDSINDAVAQQKVVPPTNPYVPTMSVKQKIAKWEADELDKFNAKLKAQQTPAPVVATSNPASITDVQLNDYTIKRFMDFDGRGKLRQRAGSESDQWQRFGRGDGHSFKGKAGDAQFTYVPYESRIRAGAEGVKAQNGLFSIEFPGWDGSAEGIERGLLSIKTQFGIDISPATQTDMEVLYWGQVFGSIAESKDGKSAWYKKLKTKIDTAFSNNPSMSPADKLKVFKDAFSEVYGSDVVDKADWRPKLSRATAGLNNYYAGWAYWERPDVDPDKLYDSLGGYGLYHQLYGGGDEIPRILTHNGFMLNTEERNRIGIPLGGGMSPSADLRTGGANYFFTRQGDPGGYSMDGKLIVSPRASVRISTVVYDSDLYGDISKRRSSRYWDVSQWKTTVASSSGNETIIKNGISLVDDVELIFVSDSNRTQIIKAYKDFGITEIRGIPIEDRIVSKQSAERAGFTSWNPQMEYYRDFFTKHRDSIFGERTPVLAQVADDDD